MSLLDEVLADVNATRAEFMLPPLTELPKGRQRDPRGCVIGNALDGLYDVTLTSLSPARLYTNQIEVWGIPSGRIKVELRVPTVRMAEFIRDFDSGVYPDLIEPEGTVFYDAEKMAEEAPF